MDTVAPEEIRNISNRMQRLLGLDRSPVGVRLLSAVDSFSMAARKLEQHRYCQALMLASRGENVVLDKNGISCPAAAAAFGFRSLPEGLRNGKGLVGFGIVAQQTTGKHMFEGMSYLPMNQIARLHLFPLDQATALPDVIVIEDDVEKLMWISLAYLNIQGGERVKSSTAVLQATCVDATIIPYLENRLNLCFGCYGCRDATDIGPNETVVGFPGTLLPKIAETLDFLNQKAIPTSRTKKAYAAMGR